jgi:tyrosine-protein kinase Etk/Wzc
LKSRTIADEIIGEYHLRSVYQQVSMFDCRKRLASRTEIDSGKDGLIHISVTDHDSNRASELANAYVNDLYTMNSTVAITEAGQRRVFFDKQVAEEKRALQKAEEDLRTVQQKTGLIQLTGQTSETIRSIAERRAKIASTEVELQSLLASETDENPDIIRLRRQLAELRQQLAALQSDRGKQIDPGDITQPAGRLPQDSLDYVRQLREVKYHDTLYELLLKQAEAARIDEAKSAPIIQVIDRALPPDKKSGPKRLLLVIGGALTGFAISCIWVVLSETIRRMKRDPRSMSRIHNMRSELEVERTVHTQQR